MYLLQVAEYVEAALRKSDLERTELQKVKTGVFSGTYARNPATAEAIPVWVADYVLGGWVVSLAFLFVEGCFYLYISRIKLRE